MGQGFFSVLQSNGNGLMALSSILLSEVSVPYPVRSWQVVPDYSPRDGHVWETREVGLHLTDHLIQKVPLPAQS